MKPTTFAPAYVGLYPALAEIAQQHGYALAIHGSVSRDFDLVCIPWTESATDADTLVRAIAERISWRIEGKIDYVMTLTEQKLHGRRSWALPIECGAVLDVSVMPRIAG